MCPIHFAFNKSVAVCYFILSLAILLTKASVHNPPSVLQIQSHTDELHLDVLPIPEESTDKIEEDGNAPVLEGVQVPYPNSPLYLNYLAQTEHLVYNALEKYEEQLLERLEILRRYKNNYKDSVLEAVRQTGLPDGEVDDWGKAQIVASNPLQSYRMIRRFAKDIHAFQDHIWQSYENELWEQLENWRGVFSWPSERDLIEASQSLIRLHDVYDFDINYFSDGEIKIKDDDIHPLKVGLMAHHCLDISQLALQLGDIHAATEWFQAAHLKVVQDADDEKTVTTDELTTVWDKTYSKFQEVWHMQNFKSHDVFSEARTLLRLGFDELKHNRTYDNRIINYKALCRWDELRTRAEISHLFCYLDDFLTPFWYISPLKVEVHSWEPFIYQIHDFLGPQKISSINSAIVPQMITAVENGVATKQPNDIDSFTHTWIHDNQSPSASIALYPLNRKIEFLANALELEVTESYHISSFAVGNHYEPCTECSDEHEELRGKRTMTLHFSLDEPDQGGELAFTLLGVLIKPYLGSLIVHPNDKTNEKITHGSCPVLIGQKWAATKNGAV